MVVGFITLLVSLIMIWQWWSLIVAALYIALLYGVTRNLPMSWFEEWNLAGKMQVFSLIVFYAVLLWVGVPKPVAFGLFGILASGYIIVASWRKLSVIRGADNRG